MRPNELALGLPVMISHVSALNDAADEAVTASILVVDNDPAASAGPVVSRLGHPLVSYVLEPEPGISAGRNRALDEASSADLLIFIDDDERPQEEWLVPLIRTWRDTKATAVMGRVISEFQAELEPWVSAGEFFTRRTMHTGTPIKVAAAGNLLLDMKQLTDLSVRFHNQFGLTGGEDTHFSKSVVKSGGRIVWCEESRTTDFVPPERMTRKWVLARSWSHGNSSTLVDLHLAAGTFGRLLVRLKAAFRGIARMAGGSARYTYGILRRSFRHQARGLRTAFRGAGMTAGALGFAYQEYARDERVDGK
ncbi:glycosyltransferase family 2 protein [Arthrobacter humicola]